MNNLLQKLADQCRTEYHDGHGNFTEQFDEEKFAELIVKECAEIASDVGTSTEPTDFALDKCYEIEYKIKKHFGVEE